LNLVEYSLSLYESVGGLENLESSLTIVDLLNLEIGFELIRLFLITSSHEEFFLTTFTTSTIKVISSTSILLALFTTYLCCNRNVNSNCAKKREKERKTNVEQL